MGIDCNLHRKLIQGKLKTEELVIKKRPLLNCLDATDPYLASTYGCCHPCCVLELESHQQALDVMEMVFKFQLKCRADFYFEDPSNSIVAKGLFIEAGAADCEFSETLPLEYKYGWTGVLLEPNMKDFETCKKVGRQAYLMHTCLGTQNTPYFTQFNFQSAGHDNHTKTTAMGGFAKQGDTHEIQCFPLESILAAINNPTVNLFVLDIEGFELAVLRAINWDKVDIEVLTVEIEHAGEFMKDSSPQIIDEFMESKGYKRFRHRKRKHHITGEDLDALYVRNDIVSKYNVVQL